MGWLANNVGPHYARSTATGAQLAIANTAAFIATFSYLMKDAPRYIAGHAINIGMIGLAMALTVVLIVYQRWENGVRARGGRDERLRDADEGSLGSRHPDFRYTL